MRKPEQLDGLDGLVIPGGESTAIAPHARSTGSSGDARLSGAPIFGTCAGMICSRTATHARIVVLGFRHRVAATPTGGRCKRSRLTSSSATGRAVARRLHPRAVDRGPGPDVEVLAEVDGQPVLAREGRILVAAFHPELTDDSRVHELFCKVVGRSAVSGHSKWSSIKHKKGAADASAASSSPSLRARSSSRPRKAGGDPDANLALQNAIEKARSYSMPKDNIERAIAKGAGDGADAAAFETIVYEGYGRGGRRGDRRDADRQPQPHRRGGAPHLLQARRQSRHDRFGGLDVRAARRRARAGRRSRRGRAHAGSRRGRGRRRSGSTAPASRSPARPSCYGTCARRSRRPASRSSRPS